jgi:hypothetical protein
VKVPTWPPGGLPEGFSMALTVRIGQMRCRESRESDLSTAD